MPSGAASILRNFASCEYPVRALKNAEVPLGDLTVLIGANNAGKTSFLDALYAAIGSGRKTLGQDDVRLENGEALPPKERVVTVDVKIRPANPDGTLADASELPRRAGLSVFASRTMAP